MVIDPRNHHQELLKLLQQLLELTIMVLDLSVSYNWFEINSDKLQILLVYQIHLKLANQCIHLDQPYQGSVILKVRQFRGFASNARIIDNA